MGAAGRLFLGEIGDTEWILEPQWGPEKFNFISVFWPICLSRPLTVPEVWLWPV